MGYDIDHQADRGRFVSVVDDRESTLRYRYEDDGALNLLSTFVAPSVRGRGVGEALVVAALEHARAEGAEVIPTCWFVETVVERHPEYHRLLRV